jgi:bacterioferritin-associated ferredoxin
MIVCHCRAVNHATVLETIGLGAGDVDSVARTCGAGSVCGGCRPTVEAFLAASDVDTAIDLPSRRAPRAVRRPGVRLSAAG